VADSESWPPGKSGISGALEYLAQKVTVVRFDGTPAPDMRVVVTLTEDGTAVHSVTVAPVAAAAGTGVDEPEDTEDPG
jgi:hypothetical protein